MSQNSQPLVKVDGQALADAVNKRLGTNHSRQYIASVKAAGIGHRALREIALDEESKILRQALNTLNSEA